MLSATTRTMASGHVHGTDHVLNIQEHMHEHGRWLECCLMKPHIDAGVEWQQEHGTAASELGESAAGC